MPPASIRIVVLAVAAGLACAAVAGPSPGRTTVLGPFTGHYAKLDPANVKPLLIAYYGTDLGWTYEHEGKLQILFGDTAANEAGDAIQASTGTAYDDGFGSIDLAAWRDPARIRPGKVPLIRLGQNPGTTEMAAIDPGMPMEQFKTPLGGFSNGTREFGVFYTSKPVGCRADADCPGGLTCDTGLGFAGERYDVPKGITFACARTTPGCTANTMVDAAGAPLAGSGFCGDRSSSVWTASDVGRVSAVAVTQRIGIRSASDPRRYENTRNWVTNKFANVALRTAQDFVPQRGSGRTHQDYRTASGEGANRRVFLWGRPGFVGVRARGRPLGLYFAYVDLPQGADLAWHPQYYSGTDERGVPQFSASERDAIAVDLDATQAGIQTEEVHDVVDQASIAWVERLGKWVMFYGGGMGRLPMPPVLPRCGLLELFTGAECADAVTGNGALRMRTADDPWGPWSPPQDLIVGGDPAARPLADQYAAGGVLFHPECQEKRCVTATHSPQLLKDEYGFLYGANIIEQWIRPAGAGVDVIWNASTWDPYRIILLRTRINR